MLWQSLSAAPESTELCTRIRRQISGPVKQRQSALHMLVFSRCFTTTYPPIPSVPPSTPQPFIVLCWRIVQWKIYDSFSNYPQLSAICACIDGDCHHGDLSDWACAGGRAEAERLDFHSFGAGGHKDNGVAHTCWVIIQYKKDDNRRGLASQAYTKASMTKMRSGTTFSFAQWPLTF